MLARFKYANAHIPRFPLHGTIKSPISCNLNLSKINNSLLLQFKQSKRNIFNHSFQSLIKPMNYGSILNLKNIKKNNNNNNNIITINHNINKRYVSQQKRGRSKNGTCWGRMNRIRARKWRKWRHTGMCLNPHLNGAPNRKAIVEAVVILQPRKPNSAKRQCIKGKIPITGRQFYAYIPFEKYPLAKWNRVMSYVCVFFFFLFVCLFVCACLFFIQHLQTHFQKK